MKKILYGSLFLFTLQTSCVLVSSSNKPLSSGKAKKCPPGHVWSDGKCHDKGKGHDKNKDHDKGKDKDKGKGHDKD